MAKHIPTIALLGLAQAPLYAGYLTGQKLSGTLNWNWVWVLFPVWGWAPLALLAFAVELLVGRMSTKAVK